MQIGRNREVLALLTWVKQEMKKRCIDPPEGYCQCKGRSGEHSAQDHAGNYYYHCNDCEKKIFYR